jgi:NADPH-dependent curcumin reductase CurA
LRDSAVLASDHHNIVQCSIELLHRNIANIRCACLCHRKERIDVKKIPLFVAAAVLTMTAATTTLAAELPAYEKAGLADIVSAASGAGRCECPATIPGRNVCGISASAKRPDPAIENQGHHELT